MRAICCRPSSPVYTHFLQRPASHLLMVQYIPASYSKLHTAQRILHDIGQPDRQQSRNIQTRPSDQSRKVRKMQTFSGSTGYRRGLRRDNRTGSHRKGRVAALKQSCCYSTAGCHRERSLLVRRPEGPKNRKPQGRIKSPVCVRGPNQDVTIGLLSDGPSARGRTALVARHGSNSPSRKLTACAACR